MTKSLRGAFSGRLRVALITHRRDFIGALSLVALVGCYLLVSHWDNDDRLREERSARKHAEAALQDATAYASVPKVTFIIQAGTPRELSLRLAEISGHLDAARMELLLDEKRGKR